MEINVKILDTRPDGRIKCTTNENTTIAIYKIPRDMIDLCDSDEFKTNGIYFLIESKKRKVYVGKSNGDIIKRIKIKDIPHNRIKDWDYLLLVVDISNTINKVFDSDFISNLEKEYWKLLNSANKTYKYNIVNKGTPPSFNSETTNILSNILDVSSKMIYVLGFEFLIQDMPFDIRDVEDKFIFEFESKGIKAKLAYDKNNRKYWLLKGSNISKKESKSCFPWISDSRKKIKKFIKDGILTKNIDYNNPSRAEGVVAGASRSGNGWKNSEGESPIDIIK